MHQLRFTPALHEEKTTGVWLQLPVTFQADAGREAAPSLVAPSTGETVLETGETPAPAAPAPDLVSESRPTPHEVAPEFKDRQQLRRLLQQSYPAELRDAGIGGTTRLWVLIDDTGVVRNTLVIRSSGYPALDSAARSVMRRTRFVPAQLRGQPVTVWVQFPVTFEVQ